MVHYSRDVQHVEKGRVSAVVTTVVLTVQVGPIGAIGLRTGLKPKQIR